MADQTKLSEAKRNLLEKYLRGHVSGDSGIRNGIAPRETGNIAPLSLTQQQTWVHHHIVPKDIPVYNETLSIHRTGCLDPAILERCLREIVRRHEIWRTTFDGNGEEFVQIVHPAPQTFPLQVLDLSDVPEAEREAEALRLATEDARRPFDLKTGPLLRALLVSLSDQQHRIYMTLHHLIFDGVTAYRVLVPELGILYKAFSAGQKSPLSEPHLQYADFSCWQRRNLPVISSEHEAYWRQQMAKELPLCQWPNDRPTVQTHRGAIERFAFPSDVVPRLRILSQQGGVSLYMTLLAGFVAVLKRYTEQDEIVIGSLTAGRNRVELERMMGHFVNPLALRFDVSGNPTFRELQLRVRNQVLEGLAHESVPFSEVVKLARQKNDPSRHPLFQIIFSQQPQLQDVPPGWELVTQEVSSGGSKLDLTVVIDDRGQSVFGPITYNPDLFDVSTIRRAVEHWWTLLAGAADDPSRGILDLPLLTKQERERVLVEWNNTMMDYPKNIPLHKFVEDQTEQTPDSIALIYETERLTYSQLNARANQLAHRLRKLGVGPDVLVSVCAERSVEMVVALLGIIKAGGAYVPLDPEYPRERLETIQEDAKSPVLLTHEHLQDRIPQGARHVILLDGNRERLHQESTQNLPADVSGKNLAYVIYTSGSTGKPKGVPNVHEGIVNRLLWMQDMYRLTADDRVLQKTPYSFDVSVWEFFWPLMTGATLVLARPSGHKDPAYLVNLIADQKVTTLHFVPSMLNTFLEVEGLEACRALRQVFVSGEALPFELQQRFFERLRAELHNLYGPTEAAVDVTYWACQPRSERQIVPIGKPIANTQIYILERSLQPVPIGVAGELHIGGIGLARGYLNRPELTAEKFIPNPFSSDAGSRLYKTGDLARFLPDGNIEYRGRMDHQVKLRGFRIELGEIESILTKCPGIGQASVIVREDTPGDKRLVAYFVSAQESTLPINGLRDFLKEKLPDYMVPAAYVRMERMPLTGNGKLDRKALPMPEGNAYAVRGYEAPQGELETQLAAIWADVLKMDRVGRNDNFFELGGHSLLAMQVTARIRRSLNLELPMRSIFDAPTIAGLAGELPKVQALGIKAPARIAQLRPGSVAASREALLAELDDLSAAELQNLLRRARDEKHSA